MVEVFKRRLELENRRSALAPSLHCHPKTLRAPVHAYAPDPGALLHVCTRAHSRLRARFTSAPVVASDLFSRTLSCISGTQNSQNRARPKMAEVSRRPSPRTNKNSSIHTPLSLELRADAALHLIVLFKMRNTHAVILHLLACQPFPA